MSFLKNFRGAQKEDIPMDWKVLNQESQLDQIITDSYQKPTVLFKHSTRCGISIGAKHRLESKWNFTSEDLDFYYLDLLNFRSISNAIAERLGIIHQSPQVIALKDGKVIYHTSHHQINVEGLRSSI
ncbi:MAG: bacillithiol system redox-active protein YtxJ [Bacteroidota bacterium]